MPYVRATLLSMKPYAHGSRRRWWWGMDASNILKPFLARGQLQIIGTTTTAGI